MQFLLQLICTTIGAKPLARHCDVEWRVFALPACTARGGGRFDRMYYYA
jgi:hypothetical protein